MELLELNQKQVLRTFFICGAIAYLIIGISNVWTNYTFWANMILSAKVSAVTANIFNFVFSWFFYSMYGFNKDEELPELEKEQVDEIIKGAQNGN